MWFEDPSTYPFRTEKGYPCRKPEGEEEQASWLCADDPNGCVACLSLEDEHPYVSFWSCTLPEGHDGPHVAHMEEDEVIGKWADEPPYRPGNWEIEEITE